MAFLLGVRHVAMEDIQIILQIGLQIMNIALVVVDTNVKCKIFFINYKIQLIILSWIKNLNNKRKYNLSKKSKFGFILLLERDFKNSSENFLLYIIISRRWKGTSWIIIILVVCRIVVVVIILSKVPHLNIWIFYTSYTGVFLKRSCKVKNLLTRLGSWFSRSDRLL